MSRHVATPRWFGAVALICVASCRDPRPSERLIEPGDREDEKPAEAAIVDPLDVDWVESVISLPESLSERRLEMASAAVQAHTIVRRFAAKHGWHRHAEQTFYTSFEVALSQRELWNRLIAIYGLDEDTKLEDSTLVAALEEGVLIVVTPDVYRDLSPEEVESDRAWTRLLAHEMAHRFHIRILEGDEEAMGPRWFYEGFASLVAGQFDIDTIPSNAGEALSLVESTSKGAYRRYTSALTYFLSRASLPNLVDHAGSDDFEDWLRTLDP